MSAWQYVFSLAFRVDGDGSTLEVVSTAACKMFVQHASVPLVAALMSRWGDAGLGWMMDAWATGKAAGFSSTNVNFVNKEGKTALILAASEGHSGLVVAFLSRPELDVNMVGSKGNTALTIAAAGGHNAAVAALVRRPELDVNVVGHDGGTALKWAAREGHDEAVITLLFRRELDVNFINDKYPRKTALMWAAERGHAAAVTALLDRPELDVNVLGDISDTAMTLAAKIDNNAAARIQICTKILRKHPRAAASEAWTKWLARQAEGQTTIMWAVGLNDLELVEAALCLPGADPTARRKDGKSARDLSM